jgi:transposase
MGKHHTEDYKLSAVKFALRTGNQVETCEVFDCKRSSLQDWIHLYKKTGSVLNKTRRNRTAYKVSKEHIDFLREEIRKKPDIYMEDLNQLFQSEFPDISLSRVHIGRLLRDNDKTRKRLRKTHQPAMYRGKERDHKNEIKMYLAEARKYDLDKIICLDETAIYSNLHPSYARCDIGKRCYIKSTDNKVFKHYSLLVAISNKKTIGWELYEEGAVNSERLMAFINKYIKGIYEDNLVIMDNAGFHKTQDVKNAVKESNNKLIYTVPYYPRSNPIEQYFSQLKHYIKKKSPITFTDIKDVVENSISKVKTDNYNNYFIHAFSPETFTKTRTTRRRTAKRYKN